MAIVRDIAAPIITSAGGFGSSGTTFNSGSVSSVSSSGLVVVVFCLGNTNGNNHGTPTFAGGGLTWTKRVEAPAPGNTSTVQIWTAPFSSAISAATFTATFSAATNNYDIMMLVDILTGTAGTFGTGATNTTNSSTMNVTIGAPATGSWSYVGVFHESANTTISPNANTIEPTGGDHYGGAGCGTGAGYSTNLGTSIGWTQTMDFGSVAGIEIKELTATGIWVPGYYF